VLAGILGATFSSALGTLVAAPRVLQALGLHKILPFSHFLSITADDGEPRPAMITTSFIVILCLLFGLAGGGLNAIAPLITMFFLISYTVLNAVVLIEQILGMVSFRPTFAIHWSVPCVGLVGCLIVMFLINPVFSMVSIFITIGIYILLLKRNLHTPWEDVRSGLFLSIAKWSAEHVARLPYTSERTWKPSILAPVTNTEELQSSYRFLKSITYPQGSINALGIYSDGKRKDLDGLNNISRAFINEGIYSNVTFLEQDNFATGVRSSIEVLSGVFFRPNLLFIPLPADNNFKDLDQLFSKASAYRIGIILLARHPVAASGQEQIINVWVRDQGPEWKLGLRLNNLDLAVLLAYQLKKNWKGSINFCMAVADSETEMEARKYFSELIKRARLKDAKTVIIRGDFETSIPKAPQADLSIFGLQKTPDWVIVQKIVRIVDATCMFVRDSGDESALA